MVFMTGVRVRLPSLISTVKGEGLFTGGEVRDIFGLQGRKGSDGKANPDNDHARLWKEKKAIKKRLHKSRL